MNALLFALLFVLQTAEDLKTAAAINRRTEVPD
jgi:hypothetical protein